MNTIDLDNAEMQIMIELLEKKSGMPQYHDVQEEINSLLHKLTSFQHEAIWNLQHRD